MIISEVIIMALHFNSSVPASQIWLQSIDPFKHNDYDLTPEECVCMLDCMVKERTVPDCMSRTGLRADTVLYWYRQSEHIRQLQEGRYGISGTEGSGKIKTDTENN